MRSAARADIAMMVSWHANGTTLPSPASIQTGVLAGRYSPVRVMTSTNTSYGDALKYCRWQASATCDSLNEINM